MTALGPAPSDTHVMETNIRCQWRNNHGNALKHLANSETDRKAKRARVKGLAETSCRLCEDLGLRAHKTHLCPIARTIWQGGIDDKVA